MLNFINIAAAAATESRSLASDWKNPVPVGAEELMAKVGSAEAAETRDGRRSLGEVDRYAQGNRTVKDASIHNVVGNVEGNGKSYNFGTRTITYADGAVVESNKVKKNSVGLRGTSSNIVTGDDVYESKSGTNISVGSISGEPSNEVVVATLGEKKELKIEEVVETPGLHRIWVVTPGEKKELKIEEVVERPGLDRVWASNSQTKTVDPIEVDGNTVVTEFYYTNGKDKPQKIVITINPGKEGEIKTTYFYGPRVKMEEYTNKGETVKVRTKDGKVTTTTDEQKYGGATTNSGGQRGRFAAGNHVVEKNGNVYETNYSGGIKIGSVTGSNTKINGQGTSSDTVVINGVVYERQW